MRGTKVFISMLFTIVLAYGLTFSNGLNLNSLGSRALSMGGAFVGLADDFSAIYWNPAGMAQFGQSYFGAYGTDIIPFGKYRMDVPTEQGPFTLVDAKTEPKHYFGGMAAYYHPVNDKLVVGIGVFTPSGLGANWDGADFAAIAGNDPSLEWSSKIEMISIVPGFAYKISDKVFFGATININYGTFKINMHAGSTPVPTPIGVVDFDLGQYSESLNGWGYGATFGALIKASEKVNLGFTFKTPSVIKMRGESSISNLNALGLNPSSNMDRDVKWPMEISGGIAVRPSPNLLFTADLQWENWATMDVMEADYSDPFWQIMMDESGDSARPMHWDNALQIRFGAEYTMNKLAIRGGFYFDPSPAPDRTMNVLLPNYDFNAFTLGMGYSFESGLQLDIGFEYLLGRERIIDFMKVMTDPMYETAMPGKHEMNIFVPTVSLGYRF